MRAPDLLKTLQTYTGQLQNSLAEEFKEGYLQNMGDVLNEYAGRTMNCNGILSLFIIHVSTLCSKTFFKEVVVFLGMYRQLMNLKGWEKFKWITGEECENEELEFCEEKSAEFLPDFSNIFITEFFPKFLIEKPFLHEEHEYSLLGTNSQKLMRVILLIQYLGAWLKVHKFTEAKLSLIKPSKSQTM